MLVILQAGAIKYRIKDLSVIDFVAICRAHNLGRDVYVEVHNGEIRETQSASMLKLRDEIALRTKEILGS